MIKDIKIEIGENLKAVIMTFMTYNYKSNRVRKVKNEKS